MVRKVSIIVPAYNAEKTIERCIKSILSQTYSNIELIVVDDGSTDNTREIVNNIKNDKIYYIRQVNQGVSVARNSGIEKSTGDFLLFVDADDIIDLNLIEDLVKCAEEFSRDIVCCNHIEQNSMLAGGNSNLAGMFIVEKDEDVEAHFWDIYIGMAIGKLYRKNVVEEGNIRFPVNINLAEDFFFVVSILCRTNKVAKIDTACYQIINSNPESLSKKYIEDIEPCIRMQIDIWKQMKSRYPNVDRIYAEGDLDYKLHKIKVFSNNLYRRGAKITYCKSIRIIKKFLNDNQDLYSNNQSVFAPKKRMRKLEGMVIKTRCATLIGTMYYMKEHIRNIKLRKIMGK